MEPALEELIGRGFPLIVFMVGLVLGISYVAFGRNLWPVILAHYALNSMSMLERVFQARPVPYSGVYQIGDV